jgi:GNAT superfamily N-acetyltransferase
VTADFEFSIRRAGVEDAADIASLLRAWGFVAHLAEFPFETVVDRVRGHMQQSQADDSHAVWVAQDPAGTVWGYVAVHWLPYLFLPGPEGYVSELFVHPDAVQRGIGGRLLDQVIVEAKRRGCSRLLLLNFRNRESYRRGFYAKHGWQERPDAANMIYDLSQR